MTFSDKISFLFFIIIAGVALISFSAEEFYSRSQIEIQGTVISRQVGQYGTPYRWYADYEIRQADGNIASYRAEGNDHSLSRGIPSGANLIKKRWKLNYIVDNRVMDDFPKQWYFGVATTGLAIFSVGIVLGILRMTEKKDSNKSVPGTAGRV